MICQNILKDFERILIFLFILKTASKYRWNSGHEVQWQERAYVFEKRRYPRAPGDHRFIHAYCSDGECNKLRSEAQGMRP
jgi:hypothetical protein